MKLHCNKFYTGVGSRETPKDILEYIRKVGKRMAELNYIGRSGSADGADYYFELGYFDYLKDAQTPHTNLHYNTIYLVIIFINKRI